MTQDEKTRGPVGGARALDNVIVGQTDDRKNTAPGLAGQADDLDPPEHDTPQRLFWEIELAAGWLAHEADQVGRHAQVYDLKHATYASRRAAAHLRALLGHIGDATALILKIQKEADDAGL